jgi:hypothetical protein
MPERYKTTDEYAEPNETPEQREMWYRVMRQRNQMLIDHTLAQIERVKQRKAKWERQAQIVRYGMLGAIIGFVILMLWLHPLMWWGGN